MPLASAIAPTQSAVQQAMRQFLTDIMPLGVQVVAAQNNSAPEPPGSFVIMTMIRFERIETNVAEAQDVKFTGSISGTVLTASGVQVGQIQPGATISGTGVVTPTHVVAQLTGAPGGAGTYSVDTDLDVPSTVMAAGLTSVTQNSIATMQLDFHSPDTSSGDMAQTFSTAFRYGYAVDFFAALGAPITPLYSDDPAQRPFVNDQKLYEWRWVVEAKLQVNQTIKVPQQFADAVTVVPVSVDASYPP